MTSTIHEIDTLLPEPGAENAAHDLALISAMMQEGRARVHVDGRHLVLWGGLLALAFFALYLRAVGSIGLDPLAIWTPITAAGWVGSFLLGHRARGDAPTTNSPNPVLVGYRAVWVGMGLVSLMGLVLMFTGANAFDGRQLAIQSCAISGIGFFVTASLNRVRWLYLVAVAWWVAYIAYAVVPALTIESLVAQAVFFIAFLMVPGLVLMASARRDHMGPDHGAEG